MERGARKEQEFALIECVYLLPGFLWMKTEQQ